MDNLFEDYLKKIDYSEKTIRSYIENVRSYFRIYKEISIENLKEWKILMLKYLSPATINLRIVAMNKYLKYIKFDYEIKQIPNPRRNRLNKVISRNELNKLKRCLLKVIKR